MSHCPSGTGGFAEALRAVLGDLLTLRAGLDITLTDSDSGIDLLISGRVSLDLARREALAIFAESHDLASVHVLDDGFLDPVSVRRAPKMRFGEVEAPLPPGGFVQATKEGEMALLEAILEWTAGVTHCADLFAGIGTFSLPLVRHSTVHAVEGARSAVEALRKAVHGTQSLKQVTLDHRDLFRRPLAAHELNRFGSVIIDPPRAGAAAQMTELARSAVPAVIAVSCNPNTFARDARLLVDGGYDLVCVRPVDQFLWSPHVELVARFLKTA
ncbi:hypothetical protein JCM17845_04450 [Iodidimonas gelatinilytica]|uniref:RNA methyltransferase n=1 Tax=Iodidimonas gelatinilytica TaxID=1236966 RepID=A0A5A7MV82_9PROT|nr:RsmD family RNA methyltransferase [Iodidimonas gelatinilytica]GEQ99821.1 hypothetical protein JCM17845_04450 [Iodidimonas gelatinilytica]